jgi:uncharacterized spore protein YtfJ
MDVGNLLMKASDSLSVRRAFGTAYEKDGMLIIPVAVVAGGGGAGTGHPRHRDSAATPIPSPRGTLRYKAQHHRTQGTWRQAGASAGWCCP